MKKMFRMIAGNDNIFDSKLVVDINYFKDVPVSLENLQWETSVLNFPKLRTYVLFKSTYLTKNYVKTLFSKRLRSVLAQFRSGILPLKVETGRFIGTPIELRLCELCPESEIEDELHFLLHCEHYNEFRQKLFSDIHSITPTFLNYNKVENYRFLMTNPCVTHAVAIFLSKALDKRTSSLSVDVSWRS